MSLLDRLRGIESPRINAHGFQAALSEWADGATGFSRVTIIAQFKLEPEDEAELDVLKMHYDSANTNAKKLRLRKTLDNILMLIGDRDVTFYATNIEVNARLAEAAS
jgi:hypothetical protein